MDNTDLVKQIQLQTTALQQQALTTIENIQLSQSQFKNVLLQRASATLASITLPSKHNFDLPLTQRQMQTLGKLNSVWIKQDSDNLVLTATKPQTGQFPLANNDANTLISKSLLHTLSNLPQGEITNGKVDANGTLKFEYQGQVYRIENSGLKPNSQVNLLVQTSTKGINVTVLSQEAKSFQLAEKVSIQQGKLNWQGNSYPLPSHLKNITGEFQLKKSAEQIELSRIPTSSNKIENKEKFTLPLEQLGKVDLSKRPQHNLVHVTREPNSNKLLVHLPSQTLQLVTKIKELNSPLAQSVIDSGKLKIITLADHKLVTTEIDTEQLKSYTGTRINAANYLQSLITHTSSKEQTLQLLASLGIKIASLPNNSKLNINISNNWKKLEVTAFTNDILIKLPTSLKEKLIQQQIISDNKVSDPFQSRQLSVESLIKTITNSKTEATTSHVAQQINQLIRQYASQQLPLSDLLTQLQQANNASDSPVKSMISQAINSYSNNKSPVEIQNLISSQLALPNLTPVVTNANNPVSQLALALQILFTGRVAKRTMTTETTKQPSTTNNDKLDKLTETLSKTLNHQQFKQLKSAQSQSNEQNEFYATLPIQVEGELRDIEVAISYEEQEKEDSTDKTTVKLIKFSLKFDLGEHGKMLSKAALLDNTLKLSIYTDSENTLKKCQDTVDEIKQQLHEHEIHLEETRFQQGKIPQHLWQESALGIQYRV